MGEIVIYETDNEVLVEVTFERDTLWLNLNQISELFGRDKSVISRHIKNIYKEGELPEYATVAKNATVQKEGARSVTRTIEYYNLDVILAVGYRVSSAKGTQFRVWATKTLNTYLIQGYVINEKRLHQREMQVRHLKTGIQILSRALEVKADEQGQAWLRQFTRGLKLLDDYDHENLDTTGLSRRKAVYPTRETYRLLINQMKSEIRTAVFGVEKDSGFESAIHQIALEFEEGEAYPSLEEKAAMLLYLIVKNHAFADGNKRIAAACFLLFLRNNKLLYSPQGNPLINQDALAGLTLFAAASKPEEMEMVKQLIISVLNRNSQDKR